MTGNYDFYPYTFINTQAVGGMSEEDFFIFCQSNEDLSFERTANGDIILMAPTGSDTGNLNIKIAKRLDLWNDTSNAGYCFDSSTGFTLPNKAILSPDASFVYKERYEALPKEDRQRFAHICPDFVVELKSKNDNLRYLHEKMAEYIDNGCSLGWLIDPYDQKVWIYQSGTDIIETNFENKLSGGSVLPGFEFDPKQLIIQ